MAVQPGLFDAPLIAGLSYWPDLIDTDEERRLLTELNGLQLAPFQFQGWLGKREVISFGWHYDFSGARLAEAPPIPDFLLPLRARAAALADLPPDALPHVLITRYDPGAGIGWHRDRPVFDRVLGISLLAPCTLRFRRRTASGFERRSIELEPGSGYALTDEVRREWEHSIAAMDQRRWSITFRSLAEGKWRARNDSNVRPSDS